MFAPRSTLSCLSLLKVPSESSAPYNPRQPQTTPYLRLSKPRFAVMGYSCTPIRLLLTQPGFRSRSELTNLDVMTDTYTRDGYNRNSEKIVSLAYQ
jgi:hypothetical protein